MFAAGKTAGAAAAVAANYIEDVFSTYLYTGNGSTQTITNGIDLAGKGGLVWIKPRASATTKSHSWWDTFRGATTYVSSNLTNGNISEPNGLTSFNSDGFTIGTNSTVNESGYGVASWTFRKQPKFFDVVTYTGDGSGSRAISHSLGSAPGCMIVKRTNLANDWVVYHRATSATPWNDIGALNKTDAWYIGAGAGFFGAAPTSTTFTVNSNLNNNGDTYVAYLFAHNAGGFGLTGTDNVISCGSVTTDSSGNGSVTLGYEPQWLLVKRTDDVSQWYLADNMRGMPVSGDGARLFPNLSNAESTSASWFRPNATGFTIDSGMFGSAVNLVYIAIRRGPMKVPTDGTKVFAPVAYTGNNTDRTVSAPFVTDLAIVKSRDASVSAGATWGDRLRGQAALDSSSTGAEFSAASVFQANPWDVQGGVKIGSGANATNNSGTTYVDWMFRRAPGFFDEVCYTGNLTQRNINHNLTVIPELFIVKSRSAVAAWYVSYYKSSTQDMEGFLNTTAALTTRDWSSGISGAASTTTTFSVGPYTDINNSGSTYVAYLFASCPGVSKVGSYTGNGTTQTIDCGFAGGARFVLIKRTDSTGDWYVYDTARGMTTLTDPYLLLNSAAAESATLGSVTTVSTGFAVDASILAAVNTNGASYIYFSVA